MQSDSHALEKRLHDSQTEIKTVFGLVRAHLPNLLDAGKLLDQTYGPQSQLDKIDHEREFQQRIHQEQPYSEEDLADFENDRQRKRQILLHPIKSLAHTLEMASQQVLDRIENREFVNLDPANQRLLFEEFLLLLWLLCDPIAHESEPHVTQFQSLPWCGDWTGIDHNNPDKQMPIRLWIRDEVLENREGWIEDLRVVLDELKQHPVFGDLIANKDKATPVRGTVGIVETADYDAADAANTSPRTTKSSKSKGGRKTLDESDPAEAARRRNLVRDAFDGEVPEGADQKAIESALKNAGNLERGDSVRAIAKWIADNAKGDLRGYLSKWYRRDETH